MINIWHNAVHILSVSNVQQAVSSGIDQMRSFSHYFTNGRMYSYMLTCIAILVLGTGRTAYLTGFFFAGCQQGSTKLELPSLYDRHQIWKLQTKIANTTSIADHGLAMLRRH
jgi:hypothetical protein